MSPHVDKYLRGQLLSGDTKQVARNLESPNAARVFTPEELSRAGSLNKGTLLGKFGEHVVAPAAGALAAGYAHGKGAGMLGTINADAATRAATNAIVHSFSPKGTLHERMAAPPSAPD